MDNERSAQQRLGDSSQRLITIARWLIGIAAFLSFLLSVYLWFTGDRQAGIFVGIWVPSIVSTGAFLVPRTTSS